MKILGSNPDVLKKKLGVNENVQAFSRFSRLSELISHTFSAAHQKTDSVTCMKVLISAF